MTQAWEYVSAASFMALLGAKGLQLHHLMVSRVFHPCCSPAIRLLWQHPCSHLGWQHVGTSSSVETGLSSRMGQLEKEKLSPGLGPAGLALCNAMASGWGMAGAVLYLPAAGTSGLQWGHSTEPLLPWGQLCSEQLPGLRAVLLWLRGASTPGLCPFLCGHGEQEPWGTVPQGGWQGRGAGRKGLPRAGGAGQEAAGVGVSVGASAGCAPLEPRGKEVQGWGWGPLW